MQYGHGGGASPPQERLKGCGDAWGVVFAVACTVCASIACWFGQVGFLLHWSSSHPVILWPRTSPHILSLTSSVAGQATGMVATRRSSHHECTTTTPRTTSSSTTLRPCTTLPMAPATGLATATGAGLGTTIRTITNTHTRTRTAIPPCNRIRSTIITTNSTARIWIIITTRSCPEEEEQPKPSTQTLDSKPQTFKTQP